MSASSENRPILDTCKDKFNAYYLQAVLCKKMKISALIDTGSSISIIHPKRFAALPEEVKPEIKKGKSLLKMADGGLVQSEGQVTLELDIDGSIFRHEFLLADVQASAVIGWDFMKAHDFSISMGSGIINY